jgi:DNA gyrase subunit A
MTTAIYETFARMSQPWINNIPEVDWHGSNGNIVIGSAPAADRYTEARLNKPIEEGMFSGIKKNIVPMILNFSEDEEWPEVLPALFPRLMINGSQGIGVTVAQVWLNHNLTELADVIQTYVQTGILDYSSLAPDFPSGGTIINKNELKSIYATGKGKAIVRGKADIEKNSILITELPYQVYVEPLIDEIKTLIDKGEITGIEDIYNKTDKKRLLIEIVCSGSPSTILNKLYASTSLQKSYSANQYALVGKTPKLLNLKEYLDLYVNHNLACIAAEARFDLDKAEQRKEIVDGLLRALENIDNIISLIKQSASSSDAKIKLQNVYSFTENQAKAIVDMKLGRLAHLEALELNEEKSELLDKISSSNLVLANSTKQKEIFVERLSSFVKKYGTTRKTNVTQLSSSKEEKEIEFVEPEKCVVIMTEAGTIKRIPASSFRTQRRNGKGVKTQEDITSAIIRTNTIDNLMIFTNFGKMYRLLVDSIPVGTNTSKGVSIKSLVEMEANENPVTMYSIYRDTDAKYVMFVTKQGIAKKTSLEEYLKTKKKSGVAAINLKEDDELASVFLVKDEDIVILTEQGYGIKIKSSDIGASARVTMGVKGIDLRQEDKVSVALPVHNENDNLAVFLRGGTGKKFGLSELPLQKRAGKGVIITKPQNNADYLISATLVEDSDNILIIGDSKSVCISASEIPALSRGKSIGNQMIKDSTIKVVSKV